MKKELNKLLKKYNENGYVRLGNIVSKKYSQLLHNRTLDLMLGKKKYEGMFFQLEGEKGQFEKIDKKLPTL